MQVGVTFPQTEIGNDPLAIRDYLQAANDQGYQHLVAYDHVISPGPSYPSSADYARQAFHEPFVLFGYAAALTQMEMVPAVIILPQRQTALVAKQAAQVDILTGGKLRLGIGVGWNSVEFDALNVDFRQRGRIFDEQIEALRQLWEQQSTTYEGKYHTLKDVGLNPRPIQRSIPLWFGGHSDIALRRIARTGDGWFPLGKPEDRRETVELLHRYLQDAGREQSTVGIEVRVNAEDGNLDEWIRQTEDWKTLGATHISLNTMNAGFTSVDQHIEALRRYKEALH